jgi:hypothetical protein
MLQGRRASAPHAVIGIAVTARLSPGGQDLQTPDHLQPNPGQGTTTGDVPNWSLRSVMLLPNPASRPNFDGLAGVWQRTPDRARSGYLPISSRVLYPNELQG